MNLTKKSTALVSLGTLDVSAVIKASHAIAEEIILEKLLDKLMQIIMKNVPAEKGLVFLQNSGKLFLTVEASSKPEQVIILPFLAVDDTSDLPISVINDLEKNGEGLVINDASQEGFFSQDTYIIKHKIKSILGLPIIYQGKLTGIVYLENSLITGAFTHEHLKILSLLCGQISISIVNASLYNHLQTYSQELDKKNQALLESSAREREKATQLEIALEELQNTQLQLIQSEKMSGLGQMVAGIAHEINNPVNFINANLSHTSNYIQDLLHLIELYQEYYPKPAKEIEEEIEAIDLEFLSQDLPKMLSSLKLGSDRIKDIVRSLRNFSRQDASQMTLIDPHEGIDTTLMILQHRLKAQPNRPAIEVIKKYGDLPMVRCYAGLLNQVFMNLIANAIDALEESFIKGDFSLAKDKGIIHIKTEFIKSDRVIIRIADNGPGMTEDVQSKLFDAFYTTKSLGKGTGIGLSISRQIIVDKHRGQLSCISVPGKGAEFTIKIPV